MRPPSVEVSKRRGFLSWPARALIVLSGLAGMLAPLPPAAAQAPLPALTGLLPPALPITQGGSGTLTATLSAAQGTPTVLRLTSDNPAVATVPATATVPANQSSIGIAVTGVAPGTATITATLNTTSAHSTVTVVAAGPTLTSLLPATLQVTQGAAGTLTVTLNAAQATDTHVALSSSAPSVANAPAEVIVPAGQTSQALAVFGVSPGSASVTASLNGTSAESKVTVVTPLPSVVSLLPPILPLTEGSSGTLTVTLNATQPTPTDVALEASDPSILGLPPGNKVTVPANAIAQAFPIIGLKRGLASVTASLNGTQATAAIEVQPPPPTVQALACPPTLTVNATGLCTVTLNATQLTSIVVPLSSSAPSVASTPPAVTVPANTLTAQFAVTGVVAGSATLTAGPLDNTTKSTDVQVVPPPPTLVSLVPSAASIFAGATTTVTLTLNAAQLADTSVPLSSSAPSLASAPAAVTVPAGSLSTVVTVSGLARGAATITAGPLNGTQAQSTITVNQLSPTVSRLTPLTLSVSKGRAGMLTVTIAPTQPDPTVVPLMSSDPGTAEAPPTVTIPAGASTADFPVLANAVGSATITAGPLNGTSQSATVTVTPPELVGLALAPAASTIAPGATHQFAATGTFTDGSAQDVTATATWSTSDPLVGTITPAGLATAVGQGSASITASAGGIISPPATLTVTAPSPGPAPPSPPAPPPPAPAADFQLSVLPATITVPAAGQASLTVALSATGGFAGLATLAVSGLPAGATATFGAAALTAGQDTLLTVRMAGLTPSGSYPLTVTATGSLRGVATTRAAGATLAVQPAGQTSLSGQILDEHARPLKGVLVRLGGLQAATDDAGNFLITNPPVGPNQVVLVDGGLASTPGRSLPLIAHTVPIVAGQANTLGFIPHLHYQKTSGMVDISDHRTERVVRDPDLPGVELRIPAGVRITGWDGRPNTRVSIRTVPVGRLPVRPPPPSVAARTVYMFYFGKQGGGTPDRPIPFTAPNDLGLAPGAKAQLWYFDEAPDGSRPNDWRMAGLGTVSADGRTIRTDPGVGIPRFCCGAALYTPNQGLNQQGGVTPQSGQGASGGDPVDLATGVFMFTKTDLVLPGRIPIAITRTYRSGDPWAGRFGIGTTLGFDDALQFPSSTVITYVYRGNARTSFTQQPDGSFTNSTVPAFRGAKIVVNPDGTRTLRFKDGRALIFSTDGLLIYVLDRAGNVVTIVRPSPSTFNLPATIQEPAGRALQLSWTGGATGRVTAVTDPLGRTVTYTYDGANRLTAVTDPAGGVTRYTYDSQHRMLTLTDPRGITYLMNEYDAKSRVCRQTQADGGTFTFCYIPADQATLPASQQLLAQAAAGGPITQAPCTGTASSALVVATVVVDPRGTPTTYQFNGQSFLTSVTNALGQTTTYTRDAGNQVTSVTDPLNRVTTFAYDPNGNVTSLTDPAGTVRTFTYEPTFHRVTSATDPLGNVTRFDYDPANGNLLRITDPLGNATQLAYNQFGQPISTTDAMGNVTQFAYNSQGDLGSITDPLGNVASRAYDQVSRLVSQTDPRGHVTTLTYNALNQVVSATDPLGGTTAFGYDPNGNLRTVTDPRGNSVTADYDSMNRRVGYTDQLGRVEAFRYDGNSNLTDTTDRTGQTSVVEYDALDRRTRTTYADGAVATLQYDAGGRLVRADDSADPNRPIAVNYDALDRVIAVTTSRGTITYSHDPLARRAQMTVGGQQPVTYTYDANSRARTIHRDPLGSITFDYDPLDRRTRLTLPNGVWTDYRYDEASRLTTLTYQSSLGPLGDLSYQYDPAGNRIAMAGSLARTLLPAQVAGAMYDPANRQSAFGSKAMAFDANGNLATLTEAGQTTTFTWDARDRLIGLSGPGLTASFAYDAFGRRALKTISGQTTTFQHDWLDVVQQSGAGGEVNYLQGLRIDESLARTDPTGQPLYYILDAMGSILALTDSAGGISSSYTYDPFGQTTVAGVTTGDPFQFTGRENDGTGLYYYRSRYYDPSVGRFCSEDPIRLLGGLNLYAYAFGNPLRFVDPSGLATVSAGVRGSVGGAGFQFGGGTSANFGYSAGTGCSASITGTAALYGSSKPSGIIPNAGLGWQVDLSNAPGVSGLPGPFLETGRNLGTTDVGFFASPDWSVKGVSISGGIQSKQLLEKTFGSADQYQWSGVAAGISDTTAILQYEKGILSIGARGDEALLRVNLPITRAVVDFLCDLAVAAITPKGPAYLSKGGGPRAWR